MLLSGGLAESQGCRNCRSSSAFDREYFSGYGYTAIVIALLSYLHPLIVIGSASCFRLMVGADAMQRMAGLRQPGIRCAGWIVLFVLASEYAVNPSTIIAARKWE
jgi:ABC-type uncharacterized transport system permease subunit